MKNKKLIIAFTVFLLASGIAAAGSGLKQMWLTDDRGTIIGSNADPWLADSVLVSESPFTLDISNHLPTESIDGTYLIITASRDPKGTGGIQVTIGPAHYSGSSDNTIEQHLILDTEWQQVSGNNGVTYKGYNTAPHGILTEGTWYSIQQIDSIGNGKYLLPDLSNNLYVDIAITSSNPSDRIHIDSVGTHMVGPDEVGFTGNPYSHDLTWQQIPEFPTIALPIAAVIGLVFFFQQRKNKEE